MHSFQRKNYSFAETPFEPCHLTFLRAMYHAAPQMMQSLETDAVNDLLQDDDIESIQAFMDNREKMNDLKEHAFKIGLMYEETQLLKSTSSSSTMHRKLNIKSDDASPKVIDCKNHLDPLLFVSNALKRQWTEAEAKVAHASEPFKALMVNVKARLDHLHNLVQVTKQKDVASSSVERNAVLENQYKMELWSLLMNDLQNTLAS